MKPTLHRCSVPSAAAALMLVAGPTAAQSVDTLDCPSFPGDPGPDTVVGYLAHDDLEGRLAGTPGERCAAEFIAHEFSRLGLVPAGSDGFLQAVPLASAARPHAPPGTGVNVVGVLPAAAGATGGVVIVGAHHDHLGRGDFGSTGTQGEIHNGADDNASGVAALIEIARRLVEGDPLGRDVVFITFTGEESGLIGSAFYARESGPQLERAVAMINLDMVGRLESDPLIVYGTGTATEWPDLVQAAADQEDLDVALEPSGYGPSDHTSFYAADVPVLHLFTNAHGDYHKESDDAERVDVDGVERVAAFAARVVRAAADRPGRLELIAGVGEPEQRSEGYGAYLGTVPDFTPVDHGVLLSGVSGGSPAEQAGIARGDVLIGLGDHEIGDLYAFTDALRAHRPGDAVVVRVLRDNQELEFTVTLGSRGSREP